MRIDKPYISKIEQNKYNKKRKDIIEKKEKEIKNLDAYYENRLANKKNESELKIVEASDQENEKLLKLSKLTDERIHKLQDHLKDTEKRLNKEQKLIRVNHQNKVDDIKNIYDEKMQSQIQKSEHDAQIINDVTLNSIKDLDFQSQQSIIDHNYKTKLLLREVEDQNNKKIKSKEDEANILKNLKEIEFKRMLANQEMEHKREMSLISNQNKSTRDNKVSLFEKEMEALENHQSSIILQKDLTFKKKFKLLTESHQKILNRMKEKFDQDIKEIIDNQSALKDGLLKKSDDSFYRISKIEPEIAEFDNHYIVTVKIPEHEKDNLRIFSDKRDLKLKVTREFKQNLQEDSQNNSKVARSEVISKTVTLPVPIGKEKISQNYQDGKLIFKVPKDTAYTH